LGSGLDSTTLENLETQVLLTLPPEQRYNVYTNWRKRGAEVNPFYGKKHTLETRQMLSDAKKGKPSAFLGFKHTNEVKKLISQQNSGTTNIERRKPLYIDDIYYESVTEAHTLTGFARNVIRQRCNSTADRFQNYQWASDYQKSNPLPDKN
jgi:hypothetical protein